MMAHQQVLDTCPIRHIAWSVLLNYKVFIIWAEKRTRTPKPLVNYNSKDAEAE